MIKDNIVEIGRMYNNTLYHLYTFQKNYERMLNSGVLKGNAKDKILDLLIEVDYQIRDYEHLLSSLENNNTPIYLDNVRGEFPIIKSDVIRERLAELEDQINKYADTFASVQKHKMLRSEYGSDIHSRLVGLDRKQKALIIQELVSEKRHVIQITKLRRAVRIYKLLNQINEIDRQIKYNNESIELNNNPIYIHRKLKEKSNIEKIEKKTKVLKSKKGKIQKRANKLITRKSLLDIRHKTMDKIAYTLK